MSAEMHLNCIGHSHSADHLHKISAFWETLRLVAKPCWFGNLCLSLGVAKINDECHLFLCQLRPTY